MGQNTKERDDASDGAQLGLSHNSSFPKKRFFPPTCKCEPRFRRAPIIQHALTDDCAVCERRSDAKITAVLVERQAAGQRSEFVFRLPWERIDATRLPKDIVTRAASGDLAELDMFAGNTGAPTMPREFAVTEVVGEYARLQAGQGYGYVSDIVFSRDGTMIAVLITRGLRQEGGTYAFGFPGFLGQWRPDMSYYGLPYVTARQATAAGLRVDPKRFEDGGAG